MAAICCPKCGSYDIADGEEFRIPTSKYHCASCNTDFGNADGHSMYDGIVKEIHLDIDGLFTDRIVFDASRSDSLISYSITSRKKGISYKGNILPEEWDALSYHIFNKCFLSDWKRISYSSRILDGTTWNIAIKLKRKHALNFHGCNGFPPYWNEFIKCLEPFFIRSGIAIEEFLV